ncbi:MAG: phosphatase PAP2 family protein [Ignavibacteriaceae bacterium]
MKDYPDFILSRIPLNDSMIKLNFDYRNSYSHVYNSLQTDSLNNIYTPKWYSMITNLPNDMVSFYNEDINVQKIPIYIGIAVSTAGLILTDNQSWKASDKFYKKSGFDKSASDIFVEIGDGRSQFGLAAAFALYGFAFKDNRALRTASEVVEAVLASGAVVQVIKHITGRESPFVSTKPGGAWRFFPNQIDYHKHVPAYDAFPSGHLTTSLAAFTVIAENYPELKWIKPVSYTAEALLAVSMVNTGIHWYSDYPLAIFLGYEFGYIIAHHGNSHQAQDNSSKRAKIVFGPYFNYTGNGLSVSLEF